MASLARLPRYLYHALLCNAHVTSTFGKVGFQGRQGYTCTVLSEDARITIFQPPYLRNALTAGAILSAGRCPDTTFTRCQALSSIIALTWLARTLRAKRACTVNFPLDSSPFFQGRIPCAWRRLSLSRWITTPWSWTRMLLGLQSRSPMSVSPFPHLPHW